MRQWSHRRALERAQFTARTGEQSSEGDLIRVWLGMRVRLENREATGAGVSRKSGSPLPVPGFGGWLGPGTIVGEGCSVYTVEAESKAQSSIPRGEIQG